MRSYYATLSYAVAAEHRSDLIRAADRSRMIADLPGRVRHRVPRRRPAWWIRVATLSLIAMVAGIGAAAAAPAPLSDPGSTAPAGPDQSAAASDGGFPWGWAGGLLLVLLVAALVVVAVTLVSRLRHRAPTTA